MIVIEFDHSVTNCSHWKSLLSEFAADGLPFEIHCWSDETEIAALALQYGQRKASSQSGGIVISGTITPPFRQMLMDLAKPTDREIYNKQTPFFSIFLGKSFSSEHYGTENYILTEPSLTCQARLQILSQINGITVSACQNAL